MLTLFALVSALGQPAITLRRADGGSTTLFRAVARPRVLFFLTTECPISRKFSPALNQLQQEFGKRVDFFAVQVDPTTTGPLAQKYAKEFGFVFPSLLDPKQKAASSLDLAVVPTAVLLDRQGQARYIGRIDDRFPRIGIQRKAPRRLDLKIAIEELLAGRKVTVPRTESVGCVMPYVAGSGS